MNGNSHCWLKTSEKPVNYVEYFRLKKRGMNRFMPRYTQKDLIIFLCGKITKKRGRTGSRRHMPVQRGEPVHAAMVQKLKSFENS